MLRNRNYLKKVKEIEDLEEGERVNDPDLSVKLIKSQTPARSHVKSFSVIIREPTHLVVQMHGVNARKEKESYVIAISKKREKWETLVSKNNNNPLVLPLARTMIQAARLGASKLTKVYMGESRFIGHQRVGVFLDEKIF